MSCLEEKNGLNNGSQDQVADESPATGQGSEQATRETEMNEYKETIKRLAADFENFKKRVERDRALWSQMAQSEVLLGLLAIVDDFDRALGQANKSNKTAELATWLTGFELISKALYKVLESYQVTEISQRTEFDPELHEAVAQVESAEIPSGSIVDVIQKGFVRNGRVLRPARVTVAK